jgi:hypothetical protein
MRPSHGVVSKPLRLLEAYRRFRHQATGPRGYVQNRKNEQVQEALDPSKETTDGS